MSDITVPQAGRQTEATDSGNLIGVDGNAFGIIAETSKMLKRAGASAGYIGTYRVSAMSGDYNHLIQVSMAYLDADPNPPSDND